MSRRLATIVLVAATMTMAMSAAGVGAAAAQEPWPAEDASALGGYGPWAFLAIVAALVVRALRRQGRYRATDVLTEPDRLAVREALARAEARTTGEIVPVVLERSDEHPGARWVLALGALLLGSALLADHLPWTSPPLLLLCQVGLGTAGWLAAYALPDLQRLVLDERRATHVVEEQAVQEFRRQGLDCTRDATGVLLLVSLLEHRVVVLGDAGIHARVDDGHWAATARVVLDGVTRGSLRNGLLAGIEACGEVLAEHFPARPGDRNELPDRLVVRRE